MTEVMLCVCMALLFVTSLISFPMMAFWVKSTLSLKLFSPPPFGANARFYRIVEDQNSAEQGDLQLEHKTPDLRDISLPVVEEAEAADEDVYATPAGSATADTTTTEATK